MSDFAEKKIPPFLLTRHNFGHDRIIIIYRGDEEALLNSVIAYWLSLLIIYLATPRADGAS